MESIWLAKKYAPPKVCFGLLAPGAASKTAPASTQAILTGLFRGVLCGVARACTWTFFWTTSEKHPGTTASTLLDIPSKYRSFVSMQKNNLCKP